MRRFFDLDVRGTPPFGAEASAGVGEVNEVESPILAEREVLAGLPVLHVRARSLSGPAPALLLFHGWRSRKEAGWVAAQALACQGVRVILPDLPGHGERGSAPPAEEGEAFWETLFGAVDEVEPLHAALLDQGLAAPGRTALAGVSAGGMVALSALARAPWARAAVALAACPAFEWLAASRRAARGERPLSLRQRERLRAYDPLALVERIAPRPLLLVHGSEGCAIPAEGARRFVEAARPLYEGHPSRLSAESQEGPAHRLTSGVLRRVQPWLRWWL